MENQAKQVSVEGPSRYAGVHVNHPSIVSAIERLAVQGKNTEYIMRITGMPQEVVTKHAREALAKEKKRKDALKG